MTFLCPVRNWKRAWKESIEKVEMWDWREHFYVFFVLHVLPTRTFAWGGGWMRKRHNMTKGEWRESERISGVVNLWNAAAFWRVGRGWASSAVEGMQFSWLKKGEVITFYGWSVVVCRKAVCDWEWEMGKKKVDIWQVAGDCRVEDEERALWAEDG